MRDQQREHESSTGKSVQIQACAYLWRELVGEFVIEYVSNGLMARLQCRKLETADATSRVLHHCS